MFPWLRCCKSYDDYEKGQLLKRQTIVYSLTFRSWFSQVTCFCFSEIVIEEMAIGMAGHSMLDVFVSACICALLPPSHPVKLSDNMAVFPDHS